MYTVKSFSGLFNQCFQISEQKEIIKTSHLPFEDGYYVTEYDIVLKVMKPTVFVLTDNGFEQSQNHFGLWYDSMTEFVNIPDYIADELLLSKYSIIMPN